MGRVRLSILALALQSGCGSPATPPSGALNPASSAATTHPAPKEKPAAMLSRKEAGQAVYLTTNRARRYDSDLGKTVIFDLTRWHRPGCLMLDQRKRYPVTVHGG